MKGEITVTSPSLIIIFSAGSASATRGRAVGSAGRGTTWSVTHSWPTSPSVVTASRGGVAKAPGEWWDERLGWRLVSEDLSLTEQMDAISTRLAADDPARGVWCVEGERAVAWTDASSLAAVVVVELPDGIEDVSWLRKNESDNINVAELDARTSLTILTWQNWMPRCESGFAWNMLVVMEPRRMEPARRGYL